MRREIVSCLGENNAQVLVDNMRPIQSVCFALLCCSALWTLVFAVDRSKFRKCTDTAFCRHFREVKESVAHYQIDDLSVERTNGIFTAKIMGGPAELFSGPLNLMVAAYESGSARVRITETATRWEPPDILLADGLRPAPFESLSHSDPRVPASIRQNTSPKEVLLFGPKKSSILVIYHSPFHVDMYHDNVLTLSANTLQLMHFEQKHDSSGRRSLAEAEAAEEDRHGGKEVVDYGEDGLAVYADGTREEKKEDKGEGGGRQLLSDWEEKFGGHTDTKPEGPMSVGMDFTFHYAAQVYGIPEHASSLALQTTAAPLSKPGATSGAGGHYKEPYRLYNLDVFEYELDEPMALYGHIPVMLGHGITTEQDGSAHGKTSGVFWFNPTETFIDVSETSSGTGRHSHWLSETGNIDFFLFPGPTTADVWMQYSRLTGTQQLPPLFSLGYHQCRWNYRDERDVASVESMFEELDYPYDVLWLDIEHTNGKRYFTWDKNVFPTPLEMQRNISAHGRKMVTIVDPHIKRDNGYAIHTEATEKGLYIKNHQGKDFDGWCWPGQSSYLDFTNARVREWWAGRFALDKYEGSTLDLFTWNDMNEPSVFNGPEVSMQKDCRNLQDIEHRYWHNLYGLYMQRATAEGLTQRDTPTQSLRPFVLSRAFWAGSQKYGAIWTGDNTATWGHLKISAPMLLSIGLAGLPFCGADVGGFFGEPGAELFTRWYQAGSFTPFFRGHAHHDTKRREPWMYGEEHTKIHRSVAMTRYTLLPYWYSTFYTSYRTGIPVMRPIFSEFPDSEAVFTMDDQWMIGSSLLVKPVTDAGHNTVDVYFPEGGGEQEGHGWYDFFTLKRMAVRQGGGLLTVSAPLSTIPVFVKGGSVVPKKMRLRRSSKLMAFDPYTLVVTPHAVTGEANGYLYMDDETSLAHERQAAYALRVFSMTVQPNGEALLKCSDGATVPAPGDNGHPFFEAPNMVERVVIAGQRRAPSSVTLGDTQVQFIYDAALQVLTLKKPPAAVNKDWEIVLHY